MSRIARLCLLILGGALWFSASSVSAQVKVQELSQFVQDQAAEYLSLRADAEVLAATMGIPVRRVQPDGTIFELQKFLDGRPIYYITDNLNAADTVSTDEVWPGGSLGPSYRAHCREKTTHLNWSSFPWRPGSAGRSSWLARLKASRPS